MKKIFLLSESSEKINHITCNFETSEVLIEEMDYDHLHKAIYKQLPDVLLIDLDSYSIQAMESISLVLQLNYVPTIGIASCSEHYMLGKQLFPDTSIIYYEQVDMLLGSLLDQALCFSGRYMRLIQSYDTLDLMDEELIGTMDKAITSDAESLPYAIADYLNQVFTENVFLRNKPSTICFIQDHSDQLNTYYWVYFFKTYHNRIVFTESFPLTEDNKAIFGISIKTGFLKNLDKQEYSDINALSDLLPEEILQHYTPQKNLVCYGTDTWISLGMDFTDEVTPYDINVIQALTIKFTLISNVRSSLVEVQDAFYYTINALSRAAEAKDDTTGQHIKRVNTFSKLLAQELGMNPAFIREMEIAAQMHDVGKIYVPEHILMKAGKLTDAEFREIQEHTLYGQRIIGDAKRLNMAAEIAACHHEKFDGSGYPRRLSGEDIPMPARIVALADIYDALRSSRSYKPPFSHQEAYNIIVYGDGRVMPSHFDPQVLQAFIDVHEKFDDFYEKLKDQ